MPKCSAGLLLYRYGTRGLEVLLAHPGGPLWARRDHGAWTVPKGEREPGEDALSTARREFAEELGRPPPPGEPIDLGELIQPSRKRVAVFAVEGDFDPDRLAGATIEIEWPPRTGRRLSIPEIDRVAWFGIDEAGDRILPGQKPFLERLLAALSRGPR